MSTDYQTLLLMVFISVVVMIMALVVPSYGSNAKTARRMRTRLDKMTQSLDNEEQSLLQAHYSKNLSPLEKSLDSIPGIHKLHEWIEQSGGDYPVYRLLLIALVLSLVAGLGVLLFTREPLYALVLAVLVFPLPILKLKIQRDRRLNLCEEQLADAIDIMTRALRAGHSFHETLELVADELADPIAKEFRTTFFNINYGMSMKVAFMDMLRRMPSMSLLAMTTAVQIQREVGGNTAEILEKIAAVVRGRFRFQRRVKTLSAEGRMSAWVLLLIPFFLAGVMMITTPDYLPVLTKDPRGINMIISIFVLEMVGMLWIRQIIRIDV